MRRREVPGTLVTAAVLAVPLLVGAGLATWALAASPLESAAPQEAVVATVSAGTRSVAVSSTVTLVPAAAVEVVARTTGTVTASTLRVGTPVTQGSEVLEVDGAPVIAYVASSPLYRDVVDGLVGADVATAQQLLVDLGYLGSVDGTVGDSTLAAIRSFNADHGRGPDDAVLALDELVWVPDGSAAPVAVDVTVGDDIDGRTPLYSTTTGSPSVTVDLEPADVDRVLTVAGTAVSLPAGTSEVTDADDVAALAAALGDAGTGVGSVAAVDPEPVGTVPAAAVVVDDDGSACFFPGVTDAPVLVEADTGGYGLVDVDADLVGTPVLVNPRTVRDDLSCAS